MTKDSNVGAGTQSYWNYEFFLKKHESNVCSLIGVCGCMYAVRASAYIPLYNEACSDFIIATTMVEQGLRAVYIPEAVCTEEPNRQAQERAGGARAHHLADVFGLVAKPHRAPIPLKSGFYAVQMWSHKLMRYLVPVFLIVIFFDFGLARDTQCCLRGGVRGAGRFSIWRRCFRGFSRRQV
jgi:hypothetical protein